MKKYREAHKDYYREKTRIWSKNKRAELRKFLQKYKLERGCKDCGYCENVDALEFDHIRGIKLSVVAKLVSTESWLRAELKKCDVVCANCHNIRTQKRRRYSLRISK